MISLCFGRKPVLLLFLGYEIIKNLNPLQKEDEYILIAGVLSFVGNIKHK